MIVTVDGKKTLDNLICVIVIFVVKFNWSVKWRCLGAPATLLFGSTHAKTP